MDYKDLSPSANYKEAAHSLYEALRWAENQRNAETVLIADIKHFYDTSSKMRQGKGIEYKDALLDRILRATMGKLM